MIEHTFKQSAPLHRIETVYLVEAEPDLLRDRGSVRIGLRIGDHSFRSYAFRRGNAAACVIPPNEVAALKLTVGESVSFEVTVRWPELDKRIPPDLGAALDEASVRLEVLEPRDQRQALHMIQEASSSEIRVQRITAVVAACKKVSEERKGE